MFVAVMIRIAAVVVATRFGVAPVVAVSMGWTRKIISTLLAFDRHRGLAATCDVGDRSESANIAMIIIKWILGTFSMFTAATIVPPIILFYTRSNLAREVRIDDLHYTAPRGQYVTPRHHIFQFCSRFCMFPSSIALHNNNPTPRLKCDTNNSPSPWSPHGWSSIHGISLVDRNPKLPQFSTLSVPDFTLAINTLFLTTVVPFVFIACIVPNYSCIHAYSQIDFPGRPPTVTEFSLYLEHKIPSVAPSHIADQSCVLGFTRNSRSEHMFELYSTDELENDGPI